MAKKAARPRATVRAIGMPHDYQAHDDLHHLKRAEEIKSDPKRHRAAVALAAKEKDALGKIARRRA